MALKAKPTQEFVPIKEIRDGIVILKDGSLRAALIASSINFALKSQENQLAIISQFQSFLNSLDFSLQIVIQSRRFDIKPYINLLQEREKVQKNDLLKLQTHEYINFVKSFVEKTSIMNKTFFIVVPYTPAIIQMGGHGSKGPLKMQSGPGSAEQQKAAQKQDAFTENMTQLRQRMSVVEQGLVRCGIRVIELQTEEVVEMFYRLFNPGETEKPIPIDE